MIHELNLQVHPYQLKGDKANIALGKQVFEILWLLTAKKNCIV